MPFLVFVLIAVAALGCLKLGAQSVLLKVLWVALSGTGVVAVCLLAIVVFLIRKHK